MSPPCPLQWSALLCDFAMLEGIPNWEMMFNLLNIHSQAAHGVAEHQAAAPVTATATLRLEKLPRPIFSLNSSEAMWNFTKTLWDAYNSQTAVTDSVKLQQLQAVCDKVLLQRLFDTGMHATLDKVELFLAKMKELAVVTVHKVVHLRKLFQVTQESDETIREYVARVTATADMCCMTMKCTCGLDNSYRDLVVHQLIIHGMRDQEIRQRVIGIPVAT